MIRAGALTFSSPLLLAPIAGFTDSPFRRIACRFGAGLVVTELISAEGLVRGNRKTFDLLRFTPEERPLGIQIFGSDPKVMARAAVEAMRFSPDIIDINMGCPSARICAGGEGGGSALLLRPALIEEITASVKKTVPVPVTAKIRLGWDESHKNYPDVVRALENGGADGIFVHGRTRAQGYSGQADWKAIARIREIARIPVIGNGDISAHDEAIRRMKESGCVAVMIGRGAIGNPWIFSGIQPSMDQIKEQIVIHLDMMRDEYGDRGIILMRKHIVKYIHGFRNAANIRVRLLSATTKEAIISILDEIK